MDRKEAAAARTPSRSEQSREVQHRRHHSGPIMSGARGTGRVSGGGGGGGGGGGLLSPGRHVRHSHDGFNSAAASAAAASAAAASATAAPVRRSQSLGRQRVGHESSGASGVGNGGGSGWVTLPGDGDMVAHDIDALLDFRMAALRDTARRQRSSSTSIEPLRRSGPLTWTGRGTAAGSSTAAAAGPAPGGGGISGGKGGASVEYEAVCREIERERGAMSRRTQEQLRRLEGGESGTGSGERTRHPRSEEDDESEEDERYTSFELSRGEDAPSPEDESIRLRRSEPPAARIAVDGLGSGIGRGGGVDGSRGGGSSGSSQDSEAYLDDEDAIDEGEESLYLAESLAKELQESVVPLAAAARPLKIGTAGAAGNDGSGGAGRLSGSGPVATVNAHRDIVEASSDAIPDDISGGICSSTATPVSDLGVSGEVGVGEGGVGERFSAAGRVPEEVASSGSRRSSKSSGSDDGSGGGGSSVDAAGEVGEEIEDRDDRTSSKDGDDGWDNARGDHGGRDVDGDGEGDAYGSVSFEDDTDADQAMPGETLSKHVSAREVSSSVASSDKILPEEVLSDGAFSHQALSDDDLPEYGLSDQDQQPVPTDQVSVPERPPPVSPKQRSTSVVVEEVTEAAIASVAIALEHSDAVPLELGSVSRDRDGVSPPRDGVSPSRGGVNSSRGGVSASRDGVGASLDSGSASGPGAYLDDSYSRNDFEASSPASGAAGSDQSSPTESRAAREAKVAENAQSQQSEIQKVGWWAFVRSWAGVGIWRCLGCGGGA